MGSYFFKADALVVTHRRRTRQRGRERRAGKRRRAKSRRQRRRRRFFGRNGEIGVACGGRSRDSREGGTNGDECSARGGRERVGNGL